MRQWPHRGAAPVPDGSVPSQPVDHWNMTDENQANEFTPETGGDDMASQNAPFTSDKRYYLTADGRVVGEDDPDRQTLLVAEGGTLSREKAEQYGLLGGGKGGEAPATKLEAPQKTTDKLEAKHVPQPPETKAVSGPGTMQAAPAKGEEGKGGDKGGVFGGRK